VIFSGLPSTKRCLVPSSKEIRGKFLEYFRQKGHAVVASAPVIPWDDPTLLFTNAGMNQFKKCFTGEETRAYVRAADTQKCLRVSGKHNDFEEVGYDGTHHTFFEMLGNWSFGDYFKKDAIAFAWTLLTREYGVDRTKLYATVYKDDDEAEGLWKKETDIDPSHVGRFEENFWEMGDTGPCGPCSEIHIDRGPGFCDPSTRHPGAECGVNVDHCGRFVELWNLVFIQYNRNEKGALEPLKFKSVDTGMGFERLVSVLNSCRSNYETDCFSPILDRLEKDTGKRRDGNLVAFQVIADHLRALTAAIADGAMPSNEGRGYVIRKILRRAIRFSRSLGKTEPYLFTLVDTVVDILGSTFPEMVQNREKVMSVLRTEEEKFLETLDTGIELIRSTVKDLRERRQDAIPGSVVFKLYDTYGFPSDITKEIAKENGLGIDTAGYERLMEEQRQRGRDSWKKKGGDELARAVAAAGFKGTVFTGYEKEEDDAVVLGIFVQKGGTWSSAASVASGEEAVVVTDRTPFYAESGGQAGDTGAIKGPGAELDVLDTQKTGDVFFHAVKAGPGVLKTGEKARLRIDGDRRRSIRLNHTATHLLQTALRQVLGQHVTQSGSQVNDARLRFDFTHPAAVAPAEILRVERLVNSFIGRAQPVKVEELDREEARKKGALAFFGDKYGDRVRVVQVEGVSAEFCGGTHIDNTGKIGLFLVVSEGSVASGIRRIEAVTSSNALDLVDGLRSDVKRASDLLKTKDGFVQKIEALIESNRKLEKELKAAKAGGAGASAGADERVIVSGGVKVSLIRTPGLAGEDLRTVADQAKNRLKSGVVVVASDSGDKTGLVISVTNDLVGRLGAGDLMKDLCGRLNGRGGGKPQFAQAGAPLNPEIDAILETFLREKIS
jgi:alanyl-tRNA synthetase